MRTVAMVASLVLCLVLAATMAWGQYGQQSVFQDIPGAGSVDWSNQVVRATGIGSPNPNQPQTAQRAGAFRAAKLDAVRNLLETVKGISLTSETTIQNAMVANDVINTRVSGVVRGYRVVGRPRYMSTGDVEVDIEVPVNGLLADALLPQSFGGGQFMSGGVPLCPTCGQAWPSGRPVPPGVNLHTTPGMQQGGAPTGGVFTGLIVDAKGLGVRPAMAPKIVDENGTEVYGSRYVSREWAVKQGMVGYDKDVNRARTNERVTNNPLIVRGVKVQGANKGDVVVSAADAARIHAAAAHQNFMDKCRVMIIVN